MLATAAVRLQVNVESGYLDPKVGAAVIQVGCCH